MDSKLYWIASPNRIARYDPRILQLEFIDLPGETTVFKTSITYKSDKQLWIATIHSGLGILNLENDKLDFISSNVDYSYGLPKAELLKLYTDSNEDLWVGSLNDGAFRLKNRYTNVKNYLPTTQENTTTTSVVDAVDLDPYILISEYSKNGLVLCDTSFRPVDNPPNWYKKMKHRIEYPRQIAKGDKVVYISNNQEVYSIDTSTLEIQSIVSQLGVDMGWFFTESMTVNENGELVLVGYKSDRNFAVAFFDPRTKKAEFYQVMGVDSEPNNTPFALPFFTNIFDATMISDSAYIIGGSSGLCLINRNNHLAKMINRELNPENDYVTAVRFLNDKLYISFYAAGLKIASYNSHSWKIIKDHRASFLDVDMLGKTMIDQKGKLWIASLMGIHALDSLGGLIHSYDATYGFYNEHLDFRNRQDFSFVGEKYLFFGGVGNATFIDISLQNEEESFSKIVVSESKVNGLSIDPNSFNKLKANENNLSFYLSVPKSYSPEKINFEYKFGDSDNWAKSESGKIQFHDLQPSQYDLYIQARNPTNQKIVGDHKISFIIRPPWFKSIWFYFLVAALGFGIVYSVYLTKIRAFKAQSRQREIFERQLQEVEMKALRSQMNPHFLFNSLNSIKNFITQNKSVEAAKHLTTFSKLMRMILSNSKEQLITIHDELAALKIYLDLESMRFEKVFSFDIDVDHSIDQLQCFVPPLLLQPFVENAIWHGLLHKESSGKLEIKVIKEGAMLNINIIDNGIGREKAANLRSKTATKHKSFGLEITKNRLNILESKYKIATQLNIIDLKNPDGKACGTQVSISIPFLKNPTK